MLTYEEPVGRVGITQEKSDRTLGNTETTDTYIPISFPISLRTPSSFSYENITQSKDNAKNKISVREQDYS